MAGINETANALQRYYSNASETKSIIKNCALVAAGAATAGSLIPVLAIPAVITSSFGAIWVMYGKLCTALGISLKENTLKLLARAAIANISTNLISMLIGTLIPVGGIAIGAIATYVTVVIAGNIFLKLILGMARSGVNVANCNDCDLKEIVKNINVDPDEINDAKNEYKDNGNQ